MSDVVSTFILESQLVAVRGLVCGSEAAELLERLLKWSRKLMLSLCYRGDEGEDDRT